MSLHNAKAHFKVAANYAQSQFEKELVQGLIQMADGMRERCNQLDEHLRSVENAVQNVTKLVKK